MSSNPNPPTSTTVNLLTQHLLTSIPPIPIPHPQFLSSIITSSSSRAAPLPALAATARHRILSSDITTPQILAASTPSFPASINDVHIQETTLNQDIPVQVIGIEDLGRSKWDQVEQLEAERKGEYTKGREIIRVIPDDPSSPTPNTTPTNPPSSIARIGGPFKLLLQDVRGQKATAFELKTVDRIGYPPIMGIGCKMTVKKGTRVARGVVLLEPERCVVLGGRVERWEKEWREGREGKVREEVAKERRERAEGAR